MPGSPARARIIASLVCGTVLAAAALAQPAENPSVPEIRGFVSEPGANLPVADAMVSIEYLGAEEPDAAAPQGESHEILATGFNGAFTIQLRRLGFYRVSVTKTGYAAGAGSSEIVGLTSERPTGEVPLLLSPAGRIVGQVLDEKTGRPIPHVLPTAWEAAKLAAINARRTLFVGRPNFGTAVATDAEGFFSISGLAPGAYVVEFGPQMPDEERVRAGFSQADLKKTDEDFEPTYWPGGGGPAEAAPVTVLPGVTVDIGQLHVKKTTYYRARVRLGGLGCSPGGDISVYDSRPGRLLQITSGAPCAGDFLISGFPSGQFNLLFAASREPASRRIASAGFTIKGRNIETGAHLRPGFMLDGTFVPSDDSKARDLSGLRITLKSFWDSILGELPLKSADPYGKFRVGLVPWGSVTVDISGLNERRYVQEIRWGNAPIQGRLLSLQPTPGADYLTVVIDDMPAVIAGFVSKSGKPASEAYVFLSAAPASGGKRYYYYRPNASVTTDEAGGFVFTGLAPGEYRIAAFRSRGVANNLRSSVLQGELTRAPIIEVGRGALKSVAVELSDLR